MTLSRINPQIWRFLSSVRSSLKSVVCTARSTIGCVMRIVLITLISLSAVLSHPHQLFNPYEAFIRYNFPYYNAFASYAHQIPTYSQFVPTYINDLVPDRVTASYLAAPDVLPNLNVLAEVPYSVSTNFTVVPMLLMSQENMRMISKAQIMSVSTTKPEMTVKTEQDIFLQCTPAVRIVLEKPIVVYSLKTSVLFPKEIHIVHDRFKIPIEVGAVIAPVRQNTFVSAETPIAITVVYAVPTKPVNLDYINNEDAIFVPETEAVIVESDLSPDLPPKNVTILNFPEQVAEPNLDVDEENEELVNRNPPSVLAPGGIVQSTQPQAVVAPFVNPKESPVLIALREESKKRL